jgi:hypothetical protein
MVCTGHWKFRPVLPLFRVHPLASNPAGLYLVDARLNAARFKRLELPIWMK